MKKSEISIALIVLDEEERVSYQEIMKNFKNIHADCYTTLDHFRKNYAMQEYAGFVVDNRTLIGSPTVDRDFFAQICQGFPVIRVSKGLGTESINCLREGEDFTDMRGMDRLEKFFKEDVYLKRPHKVRVSPRKNIFLHILIDINGHEVAAKANLWDISEGGCFILTNDIQKKHGDHIEIKILGLKDQSAIPCEIRWKKTWGTDVKRLPGYGVSFLKLTNRQKQEIISLI